MSSTEVDAMTEVKSSVGVAESDVTTLAKSVVEINDWVGISNRSDCEAKTEPVTEADGKSFGSGIKVESITSGILWEAGVGP
jgi:hypothetical protein